MNFYSGLEGTHPPELKNCNGGLTALPTPCIVLDREESDRLADESVSLRVGRRIDELAGGYYRGGGEHDIVVVHDNAVLFGMRRRSQFPR